MQIKLILIIDFFKSNLSVNLEQSGVEKMDGFNNRTYLLLFFFDWFQQVFAWICVGQC